MKSNTEQLALAEKHLGEGGSKFRKFCGMSSGPYCNAFVCYVFNEAGNASLFYGGKKVTYCPTSIKWCQNNLAQIPIYLALPSDVIYFDWEPNGTPNHIGFVRERKSDLEIYTIEGNTSKTNSSGRVVATGVVAYKTRQLYGRKNGKRVQYIQAVFRPHFKPTGFSASKKLVVDSYFGYNSIAVMQRWLGVSQDAILGVETIKALQKRLGVAQDGSWGPKTSKALQRLIGTDADGEFGPASVRAFQTYLNKAVFGSTPSTPSTSSGKYIGQACADYDHKAGDSSGKEVTKSAFQYSSSSTSPYNWTYVFRPKDATKANRAASMCEKAIANNCIGYNSHGETAYGKDKAMTKLAKAVNYDLSRITTKCGLSCGDLICLCNHWAGLSTCYIGSGLQLANKYKENSNFTCIKYTKGMALKRGDVLITAHSNGKNNHVAMVL